MTNSGTESWIGEPAGREFGSYTVVRRLGVGGMAETFEAVRGGPGAFSQRVCLKLVLPFFRGRQDFLEAFEREARLAAKLRHSNIVGVIDFGQIDEVSYMALELIDGVDLAALLDSQSGSRLSHELVALLGYELGAALEHAHDPNRDGLVGAVREEAIIHRDISPSNVLVSHRGEVLLTDFGVAKAITGTARQQSAVKGKVPYMSPEHLRADTIDGRADLFSLGVVLYEALAGRRPFIGGNDPATILMILNGERPSLKTIAPNAPPALCDIIERLIEPDPDDRPADASELRDLLHPFLPPPRVRRELGKMAAETQGSLPPVGNNEPTSGVNWYRGGSAAASGDASTEMTPQRHDLGQRRTRRWGALVLGMLLAAAGAVGVWQSGAFQNVSPPPSDQAMVAPEPSMGEPAQVEEAPPTTSPTRAAPEATKVADTRPANDPEPPEATEPIVEAVAPAHLSVVVFPWGDVWINGRRRGAAPLKDVVLKPGRYKVSAGRGEPSQTRVVRLRAGQRRALSFDLTNSQP